MFEDVDNFADLFRGGLPYYLLITLPILIMFSSNPVLASNEFPVHRMAQFDIHGVPYGCRSSALNFEAKSLYTWSTSRHCVVTRFQDMTIDQFREIRSKAGGIIMLLPLSLASMSAEAKQHIYMLEQAIMAQEITIPVYFSKYNPDISKIIDDITRNAKAGKLDQKRDSVMTELMNSISANGYQVVVSGVQHTQNKKSKIPIIQGQLAPVKHTVKDGNVDSKLPMVIVVAHFNTFGLINEHIENDDIAILLTLVDLFSKLYGSMGTEPNYRLMFVISEAGQLVNFQGMKKWLDINVEEQNVALHTADFVLCLDSIGKLGSANDGSVMYMHVSKPPKEGTQMNNFYKLLRLAGQIYGNVSIEGVHKKINLADVQLAWEHERFSMKRMPAFTLSSIKSHKDPLRSTVFNDGKEMTKRNSVLQSTKIIAEAIASFIYNVEGEVFTESMAITPTSIKSWTKIRSLQENNDLKNVFDKNLKNVKVHFDKPDLREPDFMFYEGHEGLLNVYSVKPAVFDLFLTIMIAAYLALVFFSIVYFPKLYSVMCSLSAQSYSKTKTN